MQIIEILEGAKRAITERGWTKGTLVDNNGCVCTVGALNVVIYGGPEPESPRWDEEYDEWYAKTRLSVEAQRALVAVIPTEKFATWTDTKWNEETGKWEDVQVPIEDVVDFNDKPETTVEDVLAIFDAAIETVKQGQGASA